MPRLVRRPTKVVIGFDSKQLATIDGWRRKEPDRPERSEAIRRLVRLALSSASRSSNKSKDVSNIAKSSKIAGEHIDRMLGHQAETSEEDRALRKQRLLKGPKEF